MAIIDVTNKTGEELDDGDFVALQIVDGGGGTASWRATQRLSPSDAGTVECYLGQQLMQMCGSETDGIHRIKCVNFEPNDIENEWRALRASKRARKP